MKRIAFSLGLVAATMAAAPLAAQSRNDGPWWDPANTGTRSGSSTRVDRDGRIYNDGRVNDNRGVYDSRRADGQWRRESRDRRGDVTYVRMRYDRSGNLIRERARRDRVGRFRIFDRDVIQTSRRNNRIYRDRDRDDDDDDRWDDRRGRSRNNRWAQNNGHDNGKHLGWYKNGKANGTKIKGKNKN